MSDARPRTRARSANGRPEVSDLDKRIIEHLQQDGRRPFTQIAVELGVSDADIEEQSKTDSELASTGPGMLGPSGRAPRGPID